MDGQKCEFPEFIGILEHAASVYLALFPLPLKVSQDSNVRIL
jgi:hypothetical protein